MDAKTKAQEVLFAELFKDVDDLFTKADTLKTELPQIFHQERRHLEQQFTHHLAILTKSHQETKAMLEGYVEIFQQQKVDIKNLSSEQIKNVQQQVGYIVAASEELQKKITGIDKTVDAVISSKTQTVEGAIIRGVEKALENRIAALKKATNETITASLRANQSAHIIFWKQLAGYFLAAVAGGVLVRFLP